jgi:hypothetical protein
VAAQDAEAALGHLDVVVGGCLVDLIESAAPCMKPTMGTAAAK